MEYFIKNSVQRLQIYISDFSKILPYSEPKCVIYSLMYQLFFRTTNLLLYQLLFNKKCATS